MKKTRAFLTGLLAVAAAASSLAAPPSAIGKGEGQLNIVAWPGYIERGETDKAYDWVTMFEKESGCKVNVKTAATSDEMVSLMKLGGYDIVTASGDASGRLIASKLVQEVNINLVPSYKNIDKRLQNAAWHTVNGVHYGVPYQSGPNVLMYNTDVFKKAPDSWSVVFEEQKLGDGKSNKGRVQAYDGAIYIADAALYLMHKNPALGIKDPYELNEKQYAAVLDLLRKQKQLTHRYWHDATVQMNDFKNEGVVASSSWGFMVNSLQGEKKPIASVIPKEGATGWADTTMLHANAKNVNCAYKWMEHQLSDKLQTPLAEWFGTVPVTASACKVKSPGGSTEVCKTNGWDDLDKIKFWKTPTAKCATQGDKCVPYAKWTMDYIAIMGGR
ncbi:ABC transporter substrate-binding protein [Curvibacter sp. APW13]|uniref:ABC transporter substrate-binding protein n=1 Tax=Curvibacter sp. APW13 TaxID=3077236 RepID=UPI0028DFE28F|nr:ABC transporter substrate-binding protein [Curvibacter sp. APW13]MDT8991306.1 ABC transporter substrate-binding protein [Curvibacter sp. APW13]